MVAPSREPREGKAIEKCLGRALTLQDVGFAALAIILLDSRPDLWTARSGVSGPEYQCYEAHAQCDEPDRSRE